MDDFGTLARDLGIKPLGKSAPMKSHTENRRSQIRDDLLFSDVFGGPPKYNQHSSASASDFDYDSIFNSSNATNEIKTSSSSSSVPVYDDDIFESKSVSVKQSDHFDDLIGNLQLKNDKTSRGFDDLLPGFGSNRPTSESSQPSKPTGSSNQTASDVMDDPFVVLGSTSTPGVSSPALFTDPLEEISKLSKSGNANAGGSSASAGIFDDIDPLNGFGKSMPVFSSEMNNKGTDGNSSRTGSSISSTPTSTGNEPFGKFPFKYSERHSQNKVHVNDLQDSQQTLFDMPGVSTDSPKFFGQTGSSPSYVNAMETNSQVDDMSPRSEHVQPTDDVWLTISDIPLFTRPTSAPAPSRPPPPVPGHSSKSERGFFASNTRNKGNEFPSSPKSAKYYQSSKPFRPTAKSPMVSSLDELEDFATGRTRNGVDESTDVHFGEELNRYSDADASSAAMKEAMDRAEAKFKQAKGSREREYTKSTRSKEAVQLGKDEEAMRESQEREFGENQERLHRESQQRVEKEERERRQLEKEKERERARQAVERAHREARQRAAAEARLKAERAAVQRAQAEARERAAADARERAERAAAEARERANAEAREKDAREKAAVARAEADSRRRAERAAVEKVAAEARERAAAEARERASAAKMNQQNNDNDLESFFSMGSRPSSAPRPRASTLDPVSESQSQSRGGPEGAKRTSSSGGSSSNIRKAPSAPSIVDDLSSIFGAGSSSGDFQEVEGETEERRRARLERHQRTQERAAKAVAEKNQRDLQTQRDQEERQRIGGTLDVEIKRWAAGKEGNLRALLSTLQYVLWPECGWQPVSLTDLITGASVKKVYRKATLCIHPDKVQQKGANLQQKYVAEKVFDMLKEAWNKFNSEELF